MSTNNICRPPLTFLEGERWSSLIDYIIIQLSALMKLNHKMRFCHGNSAAITTQHTLLLSVLVYRSECIFIQITNVSCLSELQRKLVAISSQTFPFPLQLQWWYCYRTSRANPELKLVHLQSWVWIYTDCWRSPTSLVALWPFIPTIMLL